MASKTAKLPGMETQAIPELTKLAEKYVDVRDDRMEHTKKEVDLKNQIIELMREQKIASYHDEESDLTITLETKTKVKVKIGTDEPDDEPE